MNSSSFVTVSDLKKMYRSKIVLHDIDLEIGPGEIVGLNGAGKSTLLKCIMGLIQYTCSLSVFAHNPFSNRSAMLEKMSYIAEVASLPSWMKVPDLFEKNLRD